MAGMSRVAGPDGKTWTVRRRWFPWRRALSLRTLWHSTPDGDKADDDATPTEGAAKSEKSGNLFATIVLGTIGGLLWLVITAGKAALILLAAVVAIVLSVTDLVLQLLVMPFVLLARACGVMRWPVQVEREHQFVRTEFADGFDAAAALRDDLSTQIQRGDLVAEPAKS
jgi:Flp pilus assembly protein TadB